MSRWSHRGRDADAPRVPAGLRAARGFTLVELIAAVAIMSLLLGAMTSAVLLTRQAVPERGTGLVALVDASDVMQQLTADLSQAVYILEHESKSVTLVVPDRDGDGLPETIRYAWSGTTGDPLTRQLNGGTAITALDNVAECTFGFETAVSVQRFEGTSDGGLGPEVLIASAPHESAAEARDPTVDTRLGQEFDPSAVTASADWVPTRILIKGLRRETGHLLEVDLVPPGGDGMPDVDAPLATAQTLSDSVQDDAWALFEVPFDDAPAVAGDGPMYFVINSTSDVKKNTVSVVKNRDSGATGLVETTDAAASWVDWRGSKSLVFELYGQLAAAAPPITVARTRLTAAAVTIEVDDPTVPTLRTGTELPNRPELLDAVWAADFNADPTSVDLNADGAADFTRSDAGLIGGLLSLLTASSQLATQPAYPFDEPTTVDCVWQATSTAGDGGVLRLFVDPGGGKVAEIGVDLSLESDGQTLVLWHRDGGSERELIEIESLPEEPVTVSLIVVPADDVVMLTVNGVYRGAFSYIVDSLSTTRGICLDTPDATPMQIDAIRIRVGGAVSQSTNTAPAASLYASQTVLPVGGGRVYFEADGSVDAEGDAMTYWWDLGDGTTAWGALVDHAYHDTGDYDVVLTVTDAWGERDTTTTTITVP